jgi:hypothetical protein
VPPEPVIPEIAYQQVLTEDASVFSVQWLDFPGQHAVELTPQAVFQRYLLHIRRFTASVIRPTITPEGVEFRLLASDISLISFTPPAEEESRESESLLLRICGGILVQRQQCHRGEFRFLVSRRDGEVRVTVQLSDYCPLILGSDKPSRVRKWLYRLTQALIHKLVTIRFLLRLYREITGLSPRLRPRKVMVRSGEET